MITFSTMSSVSPILWFQGAPRANPAQASIQRSWNMTKFQRNWDVNFDFKFLETFQRNWYIYITYLGQHTEKLKYNYLANFSAKKNIQNQELPLPCCQMPKDDRFQVTLLCRPAPFIKEWHSRKSETSAPYDTHIYILYLMDHFFYEWDLLGEAWPWIFLGGVLNSIWVNCITQPVQIF